jgi:hypothetical protein
MKGTPTMRQQTKVYTKWIAILPLIWLCGCVSPKILNCDYEDFSKMYADSSNRQLLLNLARESHEEPVYFIQLASISAQYQFTTSVGITPSYVFRHTPASLGGSLSAGLTQNPIFQFLPLTGTNFAQAVLAPISDKVFYTFYDQGWPADWVARTMVESVEKLTVVTNGITNIISNVINNGITNSITNNVPICITNYEFWVNNPMDHTYPQFLEYCHILRNAQEWHILTVDMAGSDTNTVYSSTNAKLTDVVSAISNGLSVKGDTNGRIVVTKPDQNYKFVKKNLNNDFHRYKLQLENNVTKNDNQSPTNKEAFVRDVEATDLAFTRAQTLATNIQAGYIKLKMRTFEAVLYGVGNEERLFTYYESVPPPYTNITFTDDPYGTIATVTRTSGGPLRFRPIMMIKYTDNERSHLSKLVEVDHDKIRYSVGDLEEKDFFRDKMYNISPNPYQNRTVFSIISYLFLQTAISTQNLPVQQLIQVQ